MATLICNCGHRTKLPGDSENEFFLLSNPLIADIEDKLDCNTMTGDDLSTIIVEQAMLTYRCEKCRRLYVHDAENGEPVMRVYALEDSIRMTEDEVDAL